MNPPIQFQQQLMGIVTNHQAEEIQTLKQRVSELEIYLCKLRQEFEDYKKKQEGIES